MNWGIKDLRKTLVCRPKMTSFNKFPDNCDEKEKEPHFYECYRATLSSIVSTSHM